MKLRTITMYLLTLISTNLFPEESNHERLGVKKSLSLVLTPSCDIQYQTYPIEQVEAHEMSEVFGLSAEFDRQFIVSLTAPCDTRVLIDKTLSKSAFQAAFGDLGLNLALNFDSNELAANAAVNFVLPTSSQSSDQKFGLNGGLGMWNFGVSGKLSIIRDPVLLSIGLDVSSSPFPSMVKGELCFKPYDIGLRVSLVQILNSEISTIFYTGLGIHSGLVRVSNPLVLNSYVETPLGCVLGISLSPWQFNLGIGVSLQNSQVFPSFSLGASYAIEIQ